MNFKPLIKKIVPLIVFSFYHYILAIIAAVYYRHPSNKMVIIGVTGTNGKTTVVHLISRVLEKAGHKVGRISSIDFKVRESVWRNSLKMTMPGRFYLQKLLRDMVRARCDYAVIEVTSEGIKQFRHKGINFNVGVFTNLTPEHIESHGGFEKYKKAKLSFFEYLSRSKRKNIGGKNINKVLVVNGDDKYAGKFVDFKSDKKYVYGLNRSSMFPACVKTTAGRHVPCSMINATDYQLSDEGSLFNIINNEFHLKLPGKFNIYNALAAIGVGMSQGIDMKIIKEALEGVRGIPGRMELINIGQPFKVVVDYAHTPDSLRKVYETFLSQRSNVKGQMSKMICVLGSAGGGRDKWKRAEFGKIAGQYCDEIILTNEDPYNEKPSSILNEIEEGFSQVPSSLRARGPQGPEAKFQVSRILDRREAIKKALKLAKPGDTVIITGKGAENKMMVGNGWISWDDREVVKEELKEL